MSFAALAPDPSEELSAVFSEYKKVLRSYTYPPHSFKTPLQRASALQDQRRQVKLTHLQQCEREHLASLLPQGCYTRLDVDVFRALAGRNKRHRVRIPLTMVSDGRVCWLLHMTSDDLVSAQRQSSAALAFPRFLSHFQPLTEVHSDWPLFIRKSVTEPVSLHFDRNSAAETWTSGIREKQSLQEYVKPASSQASLIRAHWKAASHTVYYVVTSGERGRYTGKKSRLRLRSILVECSEIQSDAHLQQASVDERFIVNERNARTHCVKRTKPLPEVDSQLLEVRKLLESTALHPHESIEEIVCDFILGRDRLPYLISCQGYSFSTHGRYFTKTLQITCSEATTNTTPLFTEMTESSEESQESAEDCVDKLPPQVVVLPEEKRRRRTTVRKTIVQRFACPLRMAASTLTDIKTGVEISKVATQLDAMRDRVKVFKIEKQNTVNYIEKYGGMGFWTPVLENIGRVFRADESLKQYYDHLNFEEGKMLLRGYQRIIEGNYNLYFKRSMTTVHTGKGIDSNVFYQFVHNVGVALGEFPIRPEDLEAILARFRSFESCICPK